MVLDVGEASQIGPKRMAAIRASVGKREMYFFYGLLLLLAFAASLEANINSTLLQAALASLDANALTSVLSVSVNITSILLVPLYSQASDYFGRVQLVFISLLIYTSGVGIQIISPSFTLFSVGWIASNLGMLGYSIQKEILMADLSSLENRGMLIAAESIPSTINQWISALLASSLNDSLGWRIGYLIPLCLLIPAAGGLTLFLYILQRKAKAEKANIFSKAENVPFATRFWIMLKKIDIIGFILLVSGMLLVMLSLVTVGTLPLGWHSPVILACIILGGLAFLLLVYWEFNTSQNLIPRNLFNNPTILGAFFLNLALRIDSGMNWQYMTLNFMISRKIDLTHVALLEKGYQLAYLVASLTAGLLFKKLSGYHHLLILGTAINCIGLGLMIPARLPTSSDTFIVVSQVITGIGCGITDLCLTVACHGSVARKDIAAITAASKIISSAGSALGSTIAGIVWTQLVPFKLHSLHFTIDVSRTLSDYHYVWSLPDSQFRLVAQAFGDAQMIITSASCTFAGIGFFIAIFIMRPINLAEVQLFDDNINSPSSPREII